MSALGPGGVCCREREGCKVTDCELATKDASKSKPAKTSARAEKTKEDDDE